MSTATLSIDVSARTRETVDRAVALEFDATSEPHGWLHGTVRTEGIYALYAVLTGAVRRLRLWLLRSKSLREHRTLGPLVKQLHLPVFYDIRGEYHTRVEARAQMRLTADFLVPVPRGRSLSLAPQESPYFCRPLLFTERDEQDASLFRAVEQPDKWRVAVSAPGFSHRGSGRTPDSAEVIYLLSDQKLRCLKRCLAALEDAQHGSTDVGG